MRYYRVQESSILTDDSPCYLILTENKNMKVYVYKSIDDKNWGHKYIVFIGRYYIHCDHIPNKKVTKKYIPMLCALPDSILQVLGKEFITLKAVDNEYSFILKQKYTI